MKNYYICMMLVSIFFYSCKKDTLTITGSETMYPMMLMVANAYMKITSKTKVDVKGGGSKIGIQSLIQKQTDIAVTSRELLPDESEILEKNGKLEKVIVAYDGASIVVHPQNPIQSVTLIQASEIFSGKINNWKDINGKDISIQVVIRNDNSGTGYFFKEHVLRRHDLGEEEYNKHKDLEYSPKAQTVQDNSELLDIVSKNPSAIAYIGMGSASVSSKVKLLPYHRKEQEEAIFPSIDNVYNRKYKLSRPLFVLYYQGFEKIDEFVSFLTSEKGQETVIKSGYLRSSLPEVKIIDKKQ